MPAHSLPTVSPTDARPLRVAVADDHAVVRASVAYLFASEPGLELTAAVATGREAVALTRTTPLDVLLLDLEMPDQSGLDVIGALRGHAPDLGIVVFSGYPEEQYAVPLFRRGVRGYLSKTCEPGEVVDAVRAVGEGRLYMTSRIADLLVGDLAPQEASPPHFRLSSRELQVLLRTARGQATKQVARELFLSPKTVTACRLRVMQKLGVQSAHELTYYAVKHSLLL